MKIKKILTLLAALAANTVFAGTMGPVCEKLNVTTPCATTAWEFGGRALYLQPGFSLDPWMAQRTATDSTGAAWQTYGSPPGYGWGFFFEGGYHFDQGKDFNLNLHYLKNTYRVNQPLVAGGLRTAKLTPGWVAANFEFGQQLHVGETNGMRVHAGVQYTRLHSIVDFSFIVNSLNIVGGLGEAVLVGQKEAGFNGFGPRIGVDLDYNLPTTWLNGFKAYANGALGLLAGTSNFRKTTSTLSELTSGTVTQTSNQVVPEIDAKLGLSYLYAIPSGQLTFDTGWMWIDYISGLGQIVNGGNGDVSFQGLYFGLKWLSDVA